MASHGARYATNTYVSETIWDVLNFTFKLVGDFEGADCPPMGALSNQLKACLAQKPDSSEARGNSAADSLWT